MEVVAQLVLASVFKTGEPCVKHAVGGFDSHALPPFRPAGEDCDQATHQASLFQNGQRLKRNVIRCVFINGRLFVLF